MITRKLFLNPMTFKELLASVKISAPSLSNHLKELKQKKIVTKVLDYDKETKKDRRIYKLTEEAFKLPEVQNKNFEVFTYHKILRELIEFGEPVTFSTKEEKTGYHERMLYWGLSSKYLKTKSESEIVKALDKWLSLITLFSIVQELKGKARFTEVINGLIEKLIEDVKQKDLSKFDEALKNLYSDRFEDLENIVAQAEKQKMVNDHFDKNLKEIKNLEGK